jgi:hypothetical protein
VRSPWATAVRRSQGWAATISVRRGSSASRRARAGTRRVRLAGVYHLAGQHAVPCKPGSREQVRQHRQVAVRHCHGSEAPGEAAQRGLRVGPGPEPVPGQCKLPDGSLRQRWALDRELGAYGPRGLASGAYRSCNGYVRLVSAAAGPPAIDLSASGPLVFVEVFDRNGACGS